ncbi:MAG: MoaD/ThiS family protein [Planctomycetes bacterium]|nr:MoaD/ThiS family protein [Planctomycetota bacterium]
MSVRLFARARDLAGSDTVTVELPAQASIADLKSALETQHEKLASIVPHLLVAIGTDYGDDSATLSANAEVSCFPPVSGGEHPLLAVSPRPRI